MNRLLSNMLAFVLGVALLSARAGELRDDEGTVVTDGPCEIVDQCVDLSTCWHVVKLSQTNVAYSAVGWDLAEGTAGATVRLVLCAGTFADGTFVPASSSRDLATGLTGRGYYAWLPCVDKTFYRLRHETTRDGSVVSDESLDAYFDFTECEMVTESEFRGAVLGVSQPVTCTDDAQHPWILIGGDGDGLQNAADGATLTFSFTGQGSFSAELLFASGTVRVTLDGATVETCAADADWTTNVWSVANFGKHVLTLTYSGDATVKVRHCALASEIEGAVDRGVTDVTAMDCRPVIPVATLADGVLKGFLYSAIGWERDAAASATRTASITAQAGTLSGDVFTPLSGDPVTVLAATAGSGTCDWNAKGVSKKIYRLTHTEYAGGVADTTSYLYGYFDFTVCNMWASLEDVRTAALADAKSSDDVVVTQDATWPWQPIDLTVTRSGIITESTLAADAVAATAFTFQGEGTLSYEYALTGGTLEVVTGSVVAASFDAETADWTAGAVVFPAYGTHTVVFRYTADGAGGTASLRHVRWVEVEVSDRVMSWCDNRVDLRLSPRQILRREWVLPFAYSATNWTGLTTAAADPKAAVSIVRLKGSDSAALSSWTEEPKTRRALLKPTAGEGETRWNTAAGVWKATHYLIDGTTTNATESAIFDLRETQSGTRLMAE